MAEIPSAILLHEQRRQDPVKILHQLLWKPEGRKWLMDLVSELTPPVDKINVLRGDLLSIRQAVLHAPFGHSYHPTGRSNPAAETREYRHFSREAAHRRKLEAIDEALAELDRLGEAPPEAGELEQQLDAIRRRVDDIRIDQTEEVGLVWLSEGNLRAITSQASHKEHLHALFPVHHVSDHPFGAACPVGDSPDQAARGGQADGPLLPPTRRGRNRR